MKYLELRNGQPHICDCLLPLLSILPFSLRLGACHTEVLVDGLLSPELLLQTLIHLQQANISPKNHGPPARVCPLSNG